MHSGPRPSSPPGNPRFKPEEYGGIEYGEFPVKYVVLIYAPTTFTTRYGHPRIQFATTTRHDGLVSPDEVVAHVRSPVADTVNRDCTYGNVHVPGGHHAH